MKNYIIAAAAISSLGMGALFADYYQQGGQYYPSSTYDNTSWGYDQPSNFYHAPSYDNNQMQNYPMNQGEYGQPNLYHSPMQGAPSQYYPQGGVTGTVTSPGNFTTDNRGMVPNGATAQPRSAAVNGANAQMQSQGIVKSNDNDKFTTDDDRRLGFQIRQQIAERHPGLDLNSLALYVDDGSVRISGRVKNEQEKAALSNLIKELKGVKSVNNKLEIGNAAVNGAPNSPLAVNETNQKYPSYVNPQQKNTYPNSTSNWTNTPAPTTNISGQDSILADKIRQSIASDNSLSPQAKSIGVLVNSKTITLNGTVKSESEKNRLTAKVKGLSEGRLVNNMLEVNTKR